MLKRVHDNRKVSENVAKALLQRLDRSCGTMVCHVPLQPWEDVSSHSHTRYYYSMCQIFDFVSCFFCLAVLNRFSIELFNDLPLQ